MPNETTTAEPQPPLMTLAERRRWMRLHDDDNGAIAKADSGNDLFCAALENRGLARCYDAMFGNNYYCLTPEGERAFYGR
jgi:hypothetical protein